MLRHSACFLLAAWAPLLALPGADDFDSRRVNDLRLSVGAIATPDVHESVKLGGAWSEYAWEKDSSAGIALRVRYVTRLARLGGLGGLIGGVGLGLDWADTSPRGYTFSGGEVNAQAHAPSTALYALLGELSLGWSSRVWRTPYGGFMHVEAAGFVAAGPSFAQVEDLSTTQADTATGMGLSYAVGPRLGLFLCTVPWVIGLEGEWRIANARVETQLHSGRSVLDLQGDGPAAFLTFGYRF